MTFPRSLALLLPLLVLAGLVAFFLKSGPAVQPGDGDLDRPSPDLPSAAPSAATPRAIEPETGMRVPDAPPSTAAPARVGAFTPPPPRRAQPVRVVDDAGAPVVGAEVAVLDDLPDLRPGARREPDRPPRTVGATDVDGAYVVGADAPHAGALRVRATGFAERIVGLEPFPTDIRLTRSKGLRVRVLEERGKPVGGATVRAVGPLRDVVVTTDEDGRADLVADGSEWRRLEVFAEGFVVEPFDATLTGLPVTDPLTVVLRAARPLVGRVVDEEDRMPIEGATVTLVSGAIERGVFATTTTGPDGAFTLRVEAPRWLAFTLEVAAPDRLLGLLPLARPDPAGSQPIEIRLERGRLLEGHVTDRDGAPVAGAHVQVLPTHARRPGALPRDARPVAITDAQGRFQVRAPKANADDAWQVVARGPGGEGGSMPVPRRDPPDVPLVVVLEGTGFLEGRVVAPDGAGVGGVRVRPSIAATSAWPAGTDVPPEPATGATAPAALPASTVTSPDGTFRLGPLPAGDLDVLLEREGQRLGRPMATRVLGGRTVALDPIVLDVGEISGLVLDHAGRGVSGAFVRLTRVTAEAGDGAVRDARTDELGRFRFTALDRSEPMRIDVVGQAMTSARMERAYPRAEPYELQLTRLPQLVLNVTRDGRLYDGPLLVRYVLKGSPPDSGVTATAGSETWWTAVSGRVSFILPSVATYTVHVRTAEDAPAQASGDTTIDAAEPTVMRVTLDLRVPEPTAPEGGMLPGK